MHTPTRSPGPSSPPDFPPKAPMARVFPIGTVVVVAFLALTILFLWMLVLGIQQGRA